MHVVVTRAVAVVGLSSILVVAGACGGPVRDDAVVSVSSADTSPTVGDQIAAGCSTTAVWGLATQLVEELECLQPGLFGRIDGDDKITLRSAAFPFMQKPAAEALHRVAAKRSSKLTINSGLRTLPQQFLLYEWYKAGRCGIALAAAPGSGNHQEGLAVDVDANADWRSAFEAEGYKWFGASDAVHFDYQAGGTDISGAGTRAFQRLWNRNNPGDLLEEDGDYGKQTAARLMKSPAGGFKLGATCKSEVTKDPIVVTAEPDPWQAEQGAEGDTSPVTQVESVDARGAGCAVGSQRSTMARWGGALVIALLFVRRRRVWSM